MSPREYLHHAYTEDFFCGRFTWDGLAFTPSQNAPKGEQTLGQKTCVNIPPTCPIRRLPRWKCTKWSLGGLFALRACRMLTFMERFPGMAEVFPPC